MIMMKKIMARMQIRENTSLRKKIIRMRVIIKTGLNLEMREGVRREIHQLRLNHHSYLSSHFPLSLL